MSQTETAVRRTGALVALAATSWLVAGLVPKVVGSNYAVLVPHAILLIGCAAVLLSPVHRVVAGLFPRQIFGIPGCTITCLTPLIPLLDKRHCSSAASLPAGARATWRTDAAALRRTGALVALAAASVLLLLLVPGSVVCDHWVLLPLYAVFLLGCAAVFLSPTHRVVAGLFPRQIFGIPGCTITCWTPLVPLLDKRHCCSAASSPATARATWQTSASAMRRTGALVAFAAASVLLWLLVVPDAMACNHCVLALHAMFLLGCAAVLLSPAHRAVSELARARLAAEVARETQGASARGNTALRWTGFTCILLCVAVDVQASDKPANGLFLLLFLLLLVGVWAVFLSMLAAEREPPPLPLRQPLLPAQPPAPADEGHGGGNAPAATSGVVASKICRAGGKTKEAPHQRTE